MREYYDRPQRSTDALAVLLVHEIAHIEWHNKNDSITTSEECFESEYNSVLAEIYWLIERYGQDQAIQRFERASVAFEGVDALLEWVKSQPLWQKSCGTFGTVVVPTPTPVPTRTGCELWQVETRTLQLLRGHGANTGIARRVVDRLKPVIAYSVALEAAYTAANVAFPYRDGKAITRSLDFCEWAARSPTYALLSRDAIWPYLNREWQEALNEIAMKGQLFQFYRKVD